MKIKKQQVQASVDNIIYFQCPACQTKALVDVDNEVRRLLDIDYQDRFVCEECGEEFLGEVGYDLKPKFTKIADNVESATNTCGIAARPDQLKKLEDEVVSAATPPYRKREIVKSLQDKLITRCAKWFRDDFGHMDDSELTEFLPELGYNDINDMFVVEVTLEDDGRIRAEVRAELSYDGLYDLGEACNPIVQKYDKEAYFDMDQPGIMSAYLDLDGVYGSVTNKINASTRSFEDWLYCKGVPVGEELSDDEYNSYYDQYEEERELMKDSVMSADRSGIHNIDSDVYAYLEELGDYLDDDYWAKVDALMDEFEISSADAQYYIYNFGSGKHKQSDPQSEYEYRKNVYLKRKHEFETLGEDDNNDVLSREEKMNIAKAEMDKVNPKSVKSAKDATFKNDKRLSTTSERYKGYLIVLDRGGDGYNVYDKHRELEDAGYPSKEAAKNFIDELVANDDVYSADAVDDIESEFQRIDRSGTDEEVAIAAIMYNPGTTMREAREILPTLSEDKIKDYVDYYYLRDLPRSTRIEIWNNRKNISSSSNVKASNDDYNPYSFMVGDQLEWSGLYGGQYKGVVTNVNDEYVTVEVMWTAEDSGDTIIDTQQFEIATDPEGRECIIVWTYGSNAGYVYPPSNDYINSATGANYGGAYDINPESYFTREDLDELGYSVAELVSLDLDDTVEYAGAWIEPNNELTVELKSTDYDSSVTLKVDMRKIRRPQDLTAKYAQRVADESIKQFKDWYQDEEVINSSEAIDAQYRSWYEPDDDDYIDVDEVEDVVEIELDGTQVRISPDQFDDFVDKEHKWAKYVEIEIPDFSTWVTVPPYQVEDDVWDMIADMLPEPTNEEKVYTLYGEVRLCYRVSNVIAEELEPIREPEGDYGYNYETYTDDAEIEFIRDKSQVVSLRVE